MDKSVLTKALKGFEAEECGGDFYFKLAEDYYAKGNEEKSFDFCYKAAERGCAKAQYEIGDYYYVGFYKDSCYFKEDDNAPNISVASEWYKKAYLQGHVESGFMLGMCCLDQRAFGSAIKYWREAAARGSSDAKKAVFWVNLFYLFIFAAILLGVFIFYNINTHNMSRADSVQSASVSSQFSSNGAKDNSAGAKQVETAKLEIGFSSLYDSYRGRSREFGFYTLLQPLNATVEII